VGPIRIVLVVAATVIVLLIVGFAVSYLLFASGGSGPVLVTTGKGTAP
jgi:hypothetical protein